MFLETKPLCAKYVNYVTVTVTSELINKALLVKKNLYESVKPNKDTILRSENCQTLCCWFLEV